MQKTKCSLKELPDSDKAIHLSEAGRGQRILYS